VSCMASSTEVSAMSVMIYNDDTMCFTCSRCLTFVQDTRFFVANKIWLAQEHILLPRAYVYVSVYVYLYAYVYMYVYLYAYIRL